ncbi:hypothetical protein JCM24511_04988 [Saitozyma sp. JCM 24511]|nr:hypothetical protein JCM24511_04988 [Saitozyma sp. JCM 24511]
MPTISKGDYILVTGASGFIASHTALAFLNAGYRVRGTVRSAAKGEYLAKLFADKGEGAFDYVLVDDITNDGVFDEAVKGVDAVAHLTSPFYILDVKDPQDLIQPAIKGTTGLLKSIQKNNPNLKRVVVTSSSLAIYCMESKPPTYHYTEKDWNEDAVPHVEKMGLDSVGFHSYSASKVLAEKAFWKFIEDEKPSWDGVTVNPPLVIGPVIHECASPLKVNTSVAMFYVFAAGMKREEDLPAPYHGWVNVSDVALAHVRALERPEAAGERFITANGFVFGQDYCDVLHKRFPDLPNVPVGQPDTHEERNKQVPTFDGSKAAKVLGIKYTPFEETVVDMGNSLRERFAF